MHHPAARRTGNVGKAYAVAISPDGALIAAGGWTRNISATVTEQIYIFDRARAVLVKRIDGLRNDLGPLSYWLHRSC